MKRIAPALGLVLLAPVCAEYLYGYDESTGDLEELVGGLIVFAPLYGGAALIIREAARRAGRGWPAMLILGLAFGVVQAGLVDYSMFDPSYRDIEYWDEIYQPGLIPALGFNPGLALAFASGHMIWSVAAPIAVVETFVPGRRAEPWLGLVGWSVVVTAFLLAAVFVVWWHHEEVGFVPSAGQLAGAVAVAVGLVVTAFAVGDHARRVLGSRAPRPWVAGMAAFAVFALPTAWDTLLGLIDPSSGILPQRAQASWFMVGWSGLAVNLLLLGGLVFAVLRWSRRSGWGQAHVLALSGGALLANVATAFATDPIGDVGHTAKLVHNTVAAVGVSVLLALAARRLLPRDQVRKAGAR